MTRTKIFALRLTEEERQLLGNRAQECGLTASAYAREVLLGSVPKARPGAVRRSAVAQLVRIGNNLNQLTKALHATGLFEAGQLEETLEEVRSTVQELVR